MKMLPYCRGVASPKQNSGRWEEKFYANIPTNPATGVNSPSAGLRTSSHTAHAATSSTHQPTHISTHRLSNAYALSRRRSTLPTDPGKAKE